MLLAGIHWAHNILTFIRLFEYDLKLDCQEIPGDTAVDLSESVP
jgi:hypothetical protein